MIAWSHPRRSGGGGWSLRGMGLYGEAVHKIPREGGSGEGETVGTVTHVEKGMGDSQKPSLRAWKSVVPQHGSYSPGS